MNPDRALPARNALPTLPAGPVRPDGHLALGRFAGAYDEVRWGYPTGWLDGQVKRALGRKRWFQVTVLSAERVIVVRLLDQGLVGSGFVWAADMRTGRTELETVLPGVPLANIAVGPVAGRGAHAYLTLPTAKIILRRYDQANDWTLNVQLPGHAISLSLDTHKAPPPLTSIDLLREGSPLPEPTRGVLIQRHVGLGVRGTIRFRSEVQSLEGASATLEYGNGFVFGPGDGPDTELAWSSAIVSPSAANPCLVVSDLGEGAAVVWRKGVAHRSDTLEDDQEDDPGKVDELVELGGPIRLQGAIDRQPWRIEAERVSLDFQPRCVAHEQSAPPAMLRRLTAGPLSALSPLPRAIGMQHTLVVGHFSGNLDGVRVDMAPGVCEARLFPSFSRARQGDAGS